MYEKNLETKYFQGFSNSERDLQSPSKTKKVQFSYSGKELLYYFGNLTDDDRQELIEFAKIKARKSK